MFRIRQIHDTNAPQNQMAMAAVIRIYQEAFSYYPQYAEKIATILRYSDTKDFDVALLVAEGGKNRVLGFSLNFLFPDLKFAYLDYIVSAPERSARGYGTALYESTKEMIASRKYRGLFMDVPPDDPDLLKDKSRLEINKRRLAFYERMGARPVVNTLYDRLSTPANQGYFTYLVFDDLGTGKTPSRKALCGLVAKLSNIKGGMKDGNPKLRKILDSIVDDPVRLREPIYRKPVTLPRKFKQLRVIDLVSTGDANQIHHLREKGYVERPSRVHSILRGIEPLNVREHKVRHFAEKHLTAVHTPKLVNFLKQAERELNPEQLLYPNVFPIRKPTHLPKSWDMQSGYYCIDTFTPVTANAYRAARRAVDAALSGAELILSGSPLTYVLCRPPGHHAERRAFGGFCYFNNAAVAAHHLSAHGKVAFLDIDHHHGNGSQNIFYERNDVYFISIHGHPRVAYPYFAGYRDETGEEQGKGYNRNFPLYPGVTNETYCETLSTALRIFSRFRPKYLVVSLGFDIMKGDPTGTFNLTEKGMNRIGSMLAATGLPILIVQEGGYSLRNLRAGAFEFFMGVSGTP